MAEKPLNLTQCVNYVLELLSFKIDGTNFISTLGMKYPSYRDTPPHTSNQWLAGKRKDDGAEGLWRIHNKLYDLKDFIAQHPGGEYWLEITKGTDITEAFEVHHLTDTPKNLLSKYFVKETTTPRNSVFTFDDDGFYKTLRAKIIEELPKVPKYAWHTTKKYTDGLCIAYILLCLLAVCYKSLVIGVLAGVFLSLTAIAAHNFFHQKDNFRMYYFDLTLMSSNTWRVSHALSHHLYTNTINDLEISALEPWFQYLPSKKKGFMVRYISWIYGPIVYILLFLGEFVKGLVMMNENKKFDKIHMLRFLIIIPMIIVSGSITNSVVFFIWIQTMASLYFGVVGVNAGHHHPDAFHDGDQPRSKEELDWGIYELDCVMDRSDITGSLFLVLTNFGDHALHHLFPTLDHGVLEHLYPTFLDVCKEFGVEWKLGTQLDACKGQYQQLAKVEGNKNPPKPLKKNL